jgi:hypothetical protein
MKAEMLSAYLDAELTKDERDDVDAALAASSDLRAELAELDATRSLLRALPAVQPRRPIEAFTMPIGSVPQPSRRRGRLGVAVAAVAAVWLLILSVGVSLGSLPIVPEVDQLALQHAAASDAEMPMPFKAMDTADMVTKDQAVIADIGHGMGLEGVYQLDEIVQSKYSDGLHAVSVFHEQGSVDWDDLPSGGNTEMMDDQQVWRTTVDDLDVLITQRGDLVVTVVSDGDMDHDMGATVSAMVPEVDRSRSFWSRIKAGPGNLFDRL